MRYEVIKQSSIDERVFTLKDEGGNFFEVDIYTDGEIEHPFGADTTAESWREWLSMFVGKTLEIEKIRPYLYFTSGKISILPTNESSTH